MARIQREWFHVLLCLTFVVAGGCGKEPDPRGNRVPVRGSVTLDGKPLSGARVILISDSSTGAVKATATISEGSFSFSAENGPIAGPARVEIVPELMELEEFEAARGQDKDKPFASVTVNIPPRYNLHSELTAQIQYDGDNKLSFDLHSK